MVGQPNHGEENDEKHDDDSNYNIVREPKSYASQSWKGLGLHTSQEQIYKVAMIP